MVASLAERVTKVEGSLEQMIKRIEDINNSLTKRIEDLDKRIDFVAKISIILAGSVVATLITQIALAMITRLGILP
ncbi:MAG: hypothetical protein QXE01_00280 [Sulfolobales archaeon]